jgi:hypothetical protein
MTTNTDIINFTRLFVEKFGLSLNVDDNIDGILECHQNAVRESSAIVNRALYAYFSQVANDVPVEIIKNMWQNKIADDWNAIVLSLEMEYSQKLKK